MHASSDLELSRRMPSLWVLGMGFWWAAWFSEGFKGSTWFSAGQHGPALTQAGFLVGTVPYALTFLALIVMNRRIVSLRHRPAVLAGAALVSGMGLVIVANGWTGSMGFGPSFLALIAAQAGAAVVLLGWAELFGMMGARRASIGAAASTVVGALLHVGLDLMTPVAPVLAAILLAICPVLAIVSLWFAWRHASAQPAYLEVQVEQFRMPPGITASIFVYGLVTGFMVALTTLQPHPGAGVAVAPSLWNGGVSLVIAVYALAVRRFDVRFLYWPILITVAAGFLLLPVAGYGYANDIAHAGIACVTVYWIATCADLVCRAPARAFQVMGLGALANAGGRAVGGLLSAVLHAVTSVNAWHLSVIAFAVVLVQMLVSAPLINGRAFASTLRGLANSAIAFGPELPQELIESRCAAIATARRLTPRESEILCLLAKGRTADEIARLLVISSATVRTHVRRVHEKLGVHSQPQLIRLIVFEPHEDLHAHLQSDAVEPQA